MAGLGRRTFAAGEVLTAANVMGYLQDQAVMNFAGTAARGSAIGSAVSEGMVSYLADTNSVEVYTGSAWNQVYPSVANAGEVLQVQSNIKVDSFITSSSSFTDVTGLFASITPSSATNKVLVIATVNLTSVSTSDSVVRLLRNSTVIGSGTSGSAQNGFGQFSSAYSLMQSTSTIAFFDSPATTSSVTYKVQVVQNGGSGQAQINKRGADSNFGTSSTVTLFEVKA